MKNPLNKLKRQPLVKVDPTKLPEPNDRYTYVSGPVRKKGSK